MATCNLEIVAGRGDETKGQTKMRVARDHAALLEGRQVRRSKKRSSPTKVVNKFDLAINATPMIGAVPVHTKSITFKKQLEKNTMSFRLLLKTLCELGVEDFEVVSFKELLTPLTFDQEVTGYALKSFFEFLPFFVPQFKDEGELPAIHLKVIKFLQYPICEQFFSLLLHYVYWNVVHPVARAVVNSGKLSDLEMFSDSRSDNSGTRALALSPVKRNGCHTIDETDDLSAMIESARSRSGSGEKEELFLKLENCMNKLSKLMNFNYDDMSIGQRAFVSCCHFVCDEILKQKYKWFVHEATMANAKANSYGRTTDGGDKDAQRRAYITSQNLDYCRLHLQRSVHESLSDIVDPSRLYGTDVLRREGVEGLLPAGTSTRVRGRYNTTSAAVSALLGEVQSSEARTFLNRCEPTSYGERSVCVLFVLYYLIAGICEIIYATGHRCMFYANHYIYRLHVID
jgi:hypothetical protein